MNVWIRKFMRRKGSVKEGYDGRSLTEEGYFWGRRKHLGRERKFWLCCECIKDARHDKNKHTSLN